MELTEVTERLYDLRRDRSSGYEKPYKPALLLSLIDLIEKGDFSDNKIFLTDQLIDRYLDYIKVVGGPDDTARIQYPFWHLCGDDVWTIVDVTGQPLYRSGKTSGKAPSVRQLRSSMSHASFDTEMFHFFQKPSERAVLRNAIISRYFPTQRGLIDTMRSQFLRCHNRAAEDPEQYVRPGSQPSFRQNYQASLRLPLRRLRHSNPISRSRTSGCVPPDPVFRVLQ